MWLYLPWGNWSNTNVKYLKIYLVGLIYNLTWLVDESEGTTSWLTHPSEATGAIYAPQLPFLLLYTFAQSQLLAVNHQHFILTYCISSWFAQLLEVQESGHVWQLSADTFTFSSPSPPFAGRGQRCHNLIGEAKLWEDSTRKKIINCVIGCCSQLLLKVQLSETCGQINGINAPGMVACGAWGRHGNEWEGQQQEEQGLECGREPRGFGKEAVTVPSAWNWRACWGVVRSPNMQVNVPIWTGCVGKADLWVWSDLWQSELSMAF